MIVVKNARPGVLNILHLDISCNSHFIFGAQMTTVTLGGYNFVVDHLSRCIYTYIYIYVVKNVDKS